MRKSMIALLLGCLALAVLSEQSRAAIPAFARKYDMSCNVCHSPVPKLKPYGDEFAGNGFRLPDKEPPRFTRETGDDKLLLMRELPLALRLDVSASYQTERTPEQDFATPFVLKILSGGLITEKVSYYLYFLFNERGKVAGIEDALLYFSNVANSGVDLTVGQYQVSDPLFKREARPTFEDYLIFKTKPGLSKADMAYDRGVTLGYALPTETDVVFSVLNGNGIGEADPTFDSDPYKNYFLRLAQPIDSTFQIGGFGYLGKEREFGNINDFYMAGADAKLEAGKFEVAVQYLYRSDDNPFFRNAGARRLKTQGGFAQLTYAPQLDRSNWYFFALYNRVDSDIGELKYHTATGNVSYLIARNLKFMGEYTYDIEYEHHRLTAGFVTAF